MSHKVFQCGASLILALAISFAGFTPALAAPPANDNFADATVISGLPYFDVVDNTEATREIDEPPDCSGSAWTIWYSFTPTTDTWIQVDMAGSTFSDTILAVFQDTGAGLGGLSFLDCMAWGDYIHLSVQAGKTYYFQVGSIYNQGNLQVNLQEISPLLNDDFVNATDIPSLPFSGTVDNKGATVELDEPQNCSSPWTVWYSFTPTIDATVMANTAGGNVGDTTLGIYQQNGIGLGGLSFLNCAGWGDSVTFNVQVGTTYYIQLGSIYNRGVLQVNLWKILPPPNDDFANATLISSPLPFDDSVEFNAATSLEAGEPAATCAWNGNSKTVWYTFTPTTNGSVSAYIPGGSFTPVFAVYTGDLLTNLTQIGCQSYSGNLLTFHVDAGMTYYFQIGKLYPWESDGPVAFHLETTPPPTTWFWFNPSDPTLFDTIQFNQSSYDPGNVGFKSFEWDLATAQLPQNGIQLISMLPMAITLFN